VPVSKGLTGRGPARPAISALFETTYIVSDVFDPVTVQSLRVILRANRTITTPQKHNKSATLTGFGPSIIVLLHSCSTPASLRTIRRLHTRVQDTILAALAPVLSVTDSSHDRGESLAALWANVDAHSIIELAAPRATILRQDSITGSIPGLGVAGEAEKKSNEESHGYHYTHTIDQCKPLSLAWHRKILRDSYGTMRRLRPIPCVS